LTNSKVVWPQILNEKCDDNSVSLSCIIPENLDYFNGHFPQAPILAGVVQLHWAVEYAKQKLSFTNHSVKNLEVLKFQEVIVPGQTLEIILTKKNNEKVLFSYLSEKGQHASGRIVFELSTIATAESEK